MSPLTATLLFNLIFYPLIAALSFFAGWMVLRSRHTLEKKLSILRLVTMILFIVSILVWFQFREEYSISQWFIRNIKESWGNLIAYILVFIVEIILINTLTITLPRFVYSKRLRQTTQKAAGVIFKRMLIMGLQLLTWIFLWFGFMILQALIQSPWVLYSILALWILAVLSLTNALVRLLMISGKERDPAAEAGLFPSIKEMAKKAGVNLHHLVYLRTHESKTANAWAWGGLRPMVTLYGYLYENLSSREREIVIYHELGHLKLKHTLVRMLLTVVTLSISLFLINRLLGIAGHIAPILHFIINQTIILFCTFFLPAFLYRHQEHQADLFALQHCSNPQIFATTMIHLAELNHSLTGTRSSKDMISTHPSILRRIHWLQEKTGLKFSPLETKEAPAE